MALSASEYWDKFYTENTPKYAQEPSEFLQNMLRRLQKGKALDIGMGLGVNAVYLAKNGFTVKGFDISSVAVESALKLAKESNVTIDAKKTDLDLSIMGIMETASPSDTTTSRIPNGLSENTSERNGI